MLLVRRYRKMMNITLDVAKKEVTAFFKKMEEELKESKNVEIPGFGRMRSTKEGNYFFVADRKIGIFAEDMGLEPISLKLLNQNPDQVFDISEEMSSIVSEGESLKDKPIKETDVNIETADYPVVLSLDEEEDPIIMERRKRIIIILSVINALLVLTVLFLIFKEPILGLFEGMMYSDEEMELLRQNGLL